MFVFIFLDTSHIQLSRWRSRGAKVELDQGQKWSHMSLIKGKGQGAESLLENVILMKDHEIQALNTE